MYSFETKVRFSETDSNQQLRLTSLINYFQDCSTFQSESLGLGFEDLQVRGKTWILSSWQILVNRYPSMGESVRVETWPTGFEGMYGTRNFRLCTVDGEVLAFANSIWVFMDVKRGRPVRPVPEDVQDYPLEPPMEMEYASRKITPANGGEEDASFSVLRSQIDTNNHMNNSGYVQLAMEVFPEGCKAKQIRVEYKKSAMYGDTVFTKVSKETDRDVVELFDKDGKIYAIVEFK